VIFWRILFTVCVFTTVFSFALAQHVKPDSIYKLPEVKITEDRLNDFSTGLSIIKIDSKKIEESNLRNLSEVISENSAVFLKTYGQGSLSTIAIRGTGPAHTVCSGME